MRSRITCLLLLAMASGAPAEGMRPDAQSYMAHIAAAEASLRLNEPSAARRWLRAAPEALRGFEWKLLQSRVDQSIGTLAVLPAAAQQIAISRDGRLVAAASNQAVQLFDSGGKLLHRLEAGKGEMYRVAISPDGKRVAAGGADRIVRVWNAETGALQHELAGFKTPITGVAFSQDGSTLFACNYTPLEQSPGVDGTVKLWRVDDGVEIGELRGGGVKPLSMISLSPDGSRISASSWNGEVWTWNLADKSLAQTIKLPDEGPYNAANCVAHSPDGTLIVVGAKDNAARLFDADTGKLLQTLRHGGWVTSAAFTPDGRRVVTASADEVVRIWDAATGRMVASLAGHEGGVSSIVVSPDGAQILSTGEDRQVRRWDARFAAYNGLTWDGPPGCYGLSFSPDGTQIIVNGYDGTLRRYSAFTGRELAQVQAHPKSSNWSSLSTDGARLVTCSWDKTLRLWDGRTFEAIRTIELGETAAYGCAISPDGKLLAGAFGDKTARIYDAGSGDLKRSLQGHEKPLHEVAFSPDGSLLASAATDKTARVFSVADGSAVTTIIRHAGSVEGVAFSPDGRQLASAGADGRVILSEARSGAEVWSTRVGVRGLQRVSFSPDGRRIAAAGDAVYLIDAATGAVTLRHSPRAGDVYNLSFSPAGDRLAACSADGWIAVLDTSPISEQIRRAAGANGD